MLNFKSKIFAAGAMALSLSLGSAPAVAQEFINVLTGGTSGVYYPLGVALSEIYGKGIEGARTQVQATKASVENLNLLQQGKGEIAFALGAALFAQREPRFAATMRRKAAAAYALGKKYPGACQTAPTLK